MFTIKKLLGAVLLGALISTLLSVNAIAETVNINKAGADELAKALQGVGPKQAAAIVEYREQNGSFQSLDEITNVTGIGSKTLEKNQNNLTLNDIADTTQPQAPPPSVNPSSEPMESSFQLININTASVSDLQKLKNIGPTKAELIVAYREQNGPFNSVDDLVQVSGIGPKTLESNRTFMTVN